MISWAALWLVGFMLGLKSYPCYDIGMMSYTRVDPWKIVTIVSKLGHFTYLGDKINLLILGLGHPVTKYHGHPSSHYL